MADEQDRGESAPPGSSPPPPPAYGPPYGAPPPHGAPGYGPTPGYGAPGWGPAPPGWGPPGWGPPGHPVPQKNSEKAVIVLITGIASLVVLFTCLLGFIPAIVSLCLAPGARREIAQSHGALGGEGFVRAGAICSWITIGMTLLAVVAFVLFLGAFSWSVSESVSF